MSNEKRREREYEEKRELILKSATEIIASEGIENLSIRKIANRIEYTPSVIYYYFKDKDEILDIVMQRGLMRITTAVKSACNLAIKPEDTIKHMAKEYIKAALDMPEEFLRAQLSDSDVVLKHTATMFEGAAKQKPALIVLNDSLKELYKEKEIDENTIELTSQMIVISTIGLVIKLIKEKEITAEQRDRLIDFYTDVILIRIIKI